MFEINRDTKASSQYQISWITDPGFSGKIQLWFRTIDRIQIKGGLANEKIHALANEFLTVMKVHNKFLADQLKDMEKKRLAATDSVPAMARYQASIERIKTALRESDRRIADYQRMYDAQFNHDWYRGKTKIEADPAQIRAVDASVNDFETRIKSAKRKLEIIDMKLDLVDFWINGVNYGGEHIEGNDDSLLFIQYLGNAPLEKAKAVLNVMLRDAARMMSLPDPTATFKVEIEGESGVKYEREVEKKLEPFKRAIKAEVTISAGISRRATASLEISGLKARMDAQAFAGARAKAGFNGSASRAEGISLSAEVDVFVGIEFKANVEMEIGDVFLIELSAEAAMGAVLNGKAEFTVTGADGIKLSLEAEAFLGLKLSGKAAFGFKVAGYEIVKGTATGSLNVGIGANAKLDLGFSPLGAASFQLEAGVTMGVGTDAGVAFTFDSSNVACAANALYYKAYNYFSMTKMERYAHWEYFRTLEDNDKVFEETRRILKEYRIKGESEYNVAANANIKVKMIRDIALKQWQVPTP